MKVKYIFFLLACVLVAGCSSESPEPLVKVMVVESNCSVNCYWYGGSFSCDFSSKTCPTTTFAGMYDGCDAVGCFLFDGDGNKVYVSLYDSEPASSRVTSTTLSPEGLLDMKRRLKRWFG